MTAVHGLEKRVAAILGGDHVAQRLKAADEQVADQRIVLHYQNPHFGSLTHRPSDRSIGQVPSNLTGRVS